MRNQKKVIQTSRVEAVLPPNWGGIAGQKWKMKWETLKQMIGATEVKKAFPRRVGRPSAL